MKRFILAALSLVVAHGFSLAQDQSNLSYPSDPDTQVQPGVPQGEVLHFTLDDSKIYPGTQREYWVYVPAQYDPAQPACLFFDLDGVQFNAPVVFDNLIHKKEIPVTIGVFVGSGTVIDSAGFPVRYNRSFEFDAVNDDFVRFIETELLPDVELKKASDGRPIRISKNGKDRAIAGCSSGGIGAFTAAWERPDLFSRVYSCIGTFVGMRGGDRYPVLIRKTEPKPIRVFLQDGSKDTWNPLFGSWFKGNLDMEAALSFAGYEVGHAWGEGGHDGVQGTAAENIRRTDEAIAACEQQDAEKLAELTALAEQKSALQLAFDRCTQEIAKAQAADRLVHSEKTFCLGGWVPCEDVGKLEALLSGFCCAWELTDPAPEEYPDVPVKLKNNKLTWPLNMVTEMYSLPAYDGVDPNPLMAPFFILFYGIMMADMGYGLLMFLAGFLISKKYAPKGTAGNLFGLMTLCGVSTFIMGALTGGFFGDFLTQVVKLTTGGEFALPALFTPLDDTLMILIGAMALGMVQIITGMAISFVRKLKNGQVMDAVWEELTWWVVFAGIGLMAAGMTSVVLYVGLAMVVLGPVLTNKGFGKITGIFGSLYNHITGYFGDILSYSRLMALMLAGSVIAQVFNTLGAIPGNIIVFLIISLAGNALNFALNLLGCYVHDLRLQCLEYFGKFYEDGGKPFKPLMADTKYVDITK